MGDRLPAGRKLDIAKAAMWKFVDALPKSVNVGLVRYSDYNDCGAKVVSPIMKSSPENRAQLRSAIASLRAYGNTPIGASLRRATELLESSKGKKRIVVMTDGEDTCNEAEVGRASDEAWKKGIKVYAIGFAFGALPSKTLRRIGIYKDANDDAQLASVFADIKKSLEREPGKFDEGRRDPALAETPPVSLKGKSGAFRSSGPHAGKLFKTLQLNSSYEHRFDENDRFTVLEHGYHVLFNEQEYMVDKVEVMRVRLEEKFSFIYGGVEGFVFAQDVTVR